MKDYINQVLGNSLRCILPSFWWKRLLGKMVDKIESAESSASSAMKMATLAGAEASDKQDRLVSGSNIKTICGNSILGSGNITPDPSMKVYIPMGGTLSSYYKSDNQSFYRRVMDGGYWVNSWRAIAVTASSNKEVVLLGVSYNTTQGCRILISGFQEEDITDKYECVLLEDGSVSSVTKVEGESGGSSITVDSELSDTSTNAVQNKAVTNAINAKADKTYVDEKTYNNSYAIVLASNGFHMNRYGKDGSSLGKVYIKPNVPTRVYATTFAPNGSTGRIKSIKLSHLDTQGATDMGFMFGSSDVWQNVEELDLSYLDTSSVTVMDNFAQLPKVTKLDVTSFDTSNVVNMSCMFRFCENLTDIDVSNFDTSKVLYFDSMFGQCKSLKSLDLSNFNTSSATTMSQMFFNCRDLEYLNLSSFDTSNIENLRGINGIFFGCGSIKTLILGENFFRVAAPIEGDGLQYMNSADFSGLIQWTDESVVTSLVTNSYDRIANGLPEINLSLSSQTMAILTDEHKAIIAAKGYTLQ